MKYLQLVLLVTAVLCQSALAKYNRHMTRQNQVLAALQNVLGPDNSQRIMEMHTRKRLPQTIEAIMPMATMPNIRTIPNQPCQIEQIYPRIPEIARMPNLQFVPNVPAAPVRSAPTLTMLPSVPEIINPPMPIVQPINIPEVFTMPISITPTVQEIFECPNNLPAALINPYLQGALPLSCMAPPASNLIPPVTTNIGRSHFLRKIPIPPPTL